MMVTQLPIESGSAVKRTFCLLRQAGILLLVFYCGISSVQAQRGNSRQPSLRTTQVQPLRRMARRLNRSFQQNHRIALALAKKNNWVIQRTFPDGRTIALQSVDALGKPVYYITHSNAKAAATTRTTELYAGGTLGLNLSGSSAVLKNKLGTWDGGRVRATHQELTGRVTQKDSPSTTDDHATHTSGTMIASGVNPIARGMAYQANLLAWDYNNDASEMSAAASGLLVSNHSYGELAGWYFNASRAGTATDPSWEWLGDTTISKTEDYKFGYYSSTTRSYDQLTYQAPYYLPVFSAGNNRGETGPAVGQPYYQQNANGNFVRISARPASISSNNGYDVISGGQVAKNILTVGAIAGIANGYNQASDVTMTEFSSWGPTDDGRIKPDLVADGLDLTSSVATADNAYATYSGTSMAAPNVTGTLLLLQELYASLHGDQTGNNQLMRAATLKALVLHTADEAGTSEGPDYQYGWGLLNAAKAAKVITNAESNHLLAERSLAPGETYTLSVIASGNGPLVATICWTDPAGTALPATKANLNNRSPRLVNDLDLRISDGTRINSPWVLNPGQPSAAATRGDNARDNVEQVLVPGAVAGKTYTLIVSHKGTLSGNAAQTYGLVISGIGGQAYCASAATSNQGARIERVALGAIDTTFSAGCSAYRDVTNRATDVFPGQVLNLSLTLGTCTTSADKLVKVFIDWNGDQDFADANELVSTSGVISATGNFNSSLTVPTGIVIGHSTRMRIVCVETNQAAQVMACGAYARGETQDYRLNFVRATTDVGVTALVSPEEGVCANIDQRQVTVTLKNYGSLTQVNIPVTVTVSRNEQTVATFRGTLTDTLVPFAEKNVTLSGTGFTTLAGSSYSFTAVSALPGDTDPGNNQYVASRTVSVPASPGNLSASVCGASTNLTGSGDGTIYWYNAPSGGTLLAVGTNPTTPVIPANDTYYAALNDFRGKVGPATKAFATDGGYNQFGPDVLLTTYVPLVLDSARLYIGHSGKITFTVKDTATQVEISSVTLQVTATRHPPVAYNSSTGEASANDATDTGQVYSLGLAIPTPGNYSIAISYADGATIFRNNQGVSGYPFTIDKVVSITGNTAAAAGGPTPESYYYYLYNIAVKALGCPSSRVAVLADTTAAISAAISAADTVLCGTEDTTLLRAVAGNPLKESVYFYQWKKDGGNIANATSATYVAGEAGTYTVDISNGKCLATSPPVTLVSYSEPAITLQNTTLTSSVSAGNQWLLQGVEIPGATQPTYTATSSGRYKLQSRQGSCLFLSEEVIVVVPGKEGVGNDAELSIYPNPTSGNFTLDYLLPVTASTVAVSLYDAQGKEVLTREITAGEKGGREEFEVGHLAPGMYLVKATDGNKVFIRKLVKL